jgi:hypothetical protein
VVACELRCRCAGVGTLFDRTRDIESVSNCPAFPYGIAAFRYLCIVIIAVEVAAVDVNSHFRDAVAASGCIGVNFTRRDVVGSLALLTKRRQVVRSDVTRRMVYPGLHNTECDCRGALCDDLDRRSGILLRASHQHKRGIGDAIIYSDAKFWRKAHTKFYVGVNIARWSAAGGATR